MCSVEVLIIVLGALISSSLLSGAAVSADTGNGTGREGVGTTVTGFVSIVECKKG